MTPICVVGGGGYVGLGYAVALAELGHQVVGLDIDATRVERLNRGDSPIYEVGLPEMLRRNLDAGRLRFTTDYAEAVPGSDFVFLCTGTPSLSDGEADLRQVRAAAASIGAHLQPGTLDHHRQQEHDAGRHGGARRRHRGRARAAGSGLRGRQQSGVPARRASAARHPPSRPRRARRRRCGGAGRRRRTL